MSGYLCSRMCELFEGGRDIDDDTDDDDDDDDDMVIALTSR